MLLYYYEKRTQLRISDLEFFEVSYIWRFSPARMPLLNDDEAQFILHLVLPAYVVAYLNFLKEKDHAREVYEVRTDGSLPRQSGGVSDNVSS